MAENETALEKVIRLAGPGFVTRRVVVPRHFRKNPITGKTEDVETYSYQRATRQAAGGGLQAKRALGGSYNKGPSYQNLKDAVRAKPKITSVGNRPPRGYLIKARDRRGNLLTEAQSKVQIEKALKRRSADAHRLYVAEQKRQRKTEAKAAKIKSVGSISSVGRSLAQPRAKRFPVPKPKPPQFDMIPFGPKAEPTKLMTPQSHEAHLARVNALIKNAQQHGLDTSESFTRPVIGNDGKPVQDKNGHVVREYTPERRKLHQQIIDDAIAAAVKRGVPKNRQAVMSGGLGGSGKSTVLGQPQSGVNQSDYITLNPDDMKEELIKRGMAPDVPGLQPGEKAPLIHEESSYLAKLLADAAQEQGFNVLWDIVMSGEGQVAGRLDQLDENGYTTRAVFVSIPVELSVQRALARHNQGASDYLLKGHKGMGGRYVAPEHIRASATDNPAFKSKNEQVFDKLKDQFADWKIFDTSGSGGPKLVSQKGGKAGKAANKVATAVGIETALDKVVRLTRI